MNSRNNSKIKHVTGATSASCLSELKRDSRPRFEKYGKPLLLPGSIHSQSKLQFSDYREALRERYYGAITKAPDCLPQSSTASCARRNCRRLYGE
jgi:hypothetical protein